MRLIDADALGIGKANTAMFENKGYADGWNSAIEILEQAPTMDAEPVRHGRWEWHEEPYDSRNPDGDYGWRCSCCKQDLANELSLGIPKMHYTYGILDDPDNPPTLKRCLFCGAKMNGGAEDDNA